MASKKKVLFVCVHNSARSQMAEAFVNHYGGDRFEAESAGLEAGEMNPLVIEVMKEEGLDLSGNKTKSVFEKFKNGELFSYVITVCDKEAAEQCPLFPGVMERVHWSFKDPSAVEGSLEEKLGQIRAIRDQIKQAVIDWLAEN